MDPPVIKQWLWRMKVLAAGGADVFPVASVDKAAALVDLAVCKPYLHAAALKFVFSD